MALVVARVKAILRAWILMNERNNEITWPPSAHADSYMQKILRATRAGGKNESWVGVPEVLLPTHAKRATLEPALSESRYKHAGDKAIDIPRGRLVDRESWRTMIDITANITTRWRKATEGQLTIHERGSYSGKWEKTEENWRAHSSIKCVSVGLHWRQLTIAE